MELRKAFGDQLFKLRMSKGYSLSEVGKKVGISTNYVGELERGVKEPSDEVVRKLANVYGIPEEQFFNVLNRVPLGIKEEVETSPELKKLISEIASNKELAEDTKENLYRKVREYYEKLLDEYN